MAIVQRRKQAAGGARASRIALRAPESGDRGAARARASLEREVHRLERLCEAMRVSAERGSRDQAELLRAMAHEIRTPLSVIIMHAAILQRSLGAEHGGRRQAATIMRQAEEIDRMLYDVSDAGKLESGMLDIDPKPQDALALVERAIDHARPMALAKPIRIEHFVDPDLGQVLGDEARVVRVLTTLINNAIKFTPTNGSVAVRAEPDEEGTRFSVTDGGPGIPDENRPLLFSRLFNKPGTYKPVQGAGLPLFVAKGIVEALGGRMDAHNNEGGGSTFYFTLPEAQLGDELEPVSAA
jgi:signal transduction histidine kinase